MDHLILPKHPIHPPLEIRLRNHEVYDAGDFVTYPDRQGWGERSVAKWEQLFTRKDDSFVAFLERWLLFGPASAFFGSYFNSLDFVRVTDDPAHPVFTTTHLPELLRQFTPELLNPTGRRLRDMIEAGNLEAILSHASDDSILGQESLSNIVSLSSFIKLYSNVYKDPRDDTIVLATSTMLETITTLMHFDHESQYPNVSTQCIYQGDSFLWRKLREDGWCPSELSRLLPTSNTASLYFLYNLERSKSHETHQMIRVRRKSRGNEDYMESSSPTRLCTTWECTHRKLREDEYKTKHTDECKGCSDMVACPDQLREILERGGIPLILSVEESDDENPRIMLIEAEPGIAYVAISHVWSDGLGNIERNSLPRCQVLRLSKMVRRLPGEHSNILLFWCDTICIPPDSSGMTEAQNMALGKMRRIYADARAVLVLDSWLFSTDTRNMNQVEIIMRILYSHWNTRLWTYQEGALAASLYFQFDNEAYNLDSGIKELRKNTDPMANLTIIQPLLRKHHNLRGFQNEKTVERKLMAVPSGLAHRTTSVATDEPLCLAVLLDLDVAAIARTAPNLRMEKFWKILSKIPADLIFNSVACFHIDGIRWAPTTFLTSPLNATGHGLPSFIDDIIDSTMCEREERGVLVACKGVRFSVGEMNIGDYLNLKDSHGTWFQISFTFRYADDVSSPFLAQHTQRTLNPHQVFGFREVAVLGRKVFGELSTTRPVTPTTTIESGMLVGIDREESGVIYCRNIGNCMIMNRDEVESPPSFPFVTYGGLFFGDTKLKVVRIVAGKSAPESQIWCVG